jgi:hypothetical protein
LKEEVEMENKSAWSSIDPTYSRRQHKGVTFDEFVEHFIGMVYRSCGQPVFEHIYLQKHSRLPGSKKNEEVEEKTPGHCP